MQQEAVSGLIVPTMAAAQFFDQQALSILLTDTERPGTAYVLLRGSMIIGRQGTVVLFRSNGAETRYPNSSRNRFMVFVNQHLV
jgi:hypothetical protein